MEKLDPELTDKSVGLGPRYNQLTNLLLKGRNNILVTCRNYQSANLIASNIKTVLTNQFSELMFYDDKDIETFIADSILDSYDSAFSELSEQMNKLDRLKELKKVIILKNSLMLEEKKIEILLNLTKESSSLVNRLIVFCDTENYRNKFKGFIEEFEIIDGDDLESEQADRSKDKLLQKEEQEQVTEGRSKNLNKNTQNKKIEKKLNGKVILILLMMSFFALSFSENAQDLFFKSLESMSGYILTNKNE
ncbi:MAG: hypothetical protein CMK54_01420 [Proteobacteria bacterium]|nr:hypothetical protein [Pseudomonadota bacterium]